MSTTAFVHGFTSTAMLIMAIGAQNAFVLRQGLRREHVLPVVLVCALADAVLLQVGVWGMGGVLLARPEWAQAMRWAGALFLLVCAAQTAARALRPGTLLVATSGAGAGLRTTLATVVALTWLNPHVYLDTVVLLGSLSTRHSGAAQWVFGLGACTASLVWFSSLGFGARLLQPLFRHPRAWQLLDAGIALTMGVLCVLLLRGT